MTKNNDLDLWYALHDSTLSRIESDAANGTAKISINNPSLNKYLSRAEGALFDICFIGVKSLQVLVSRKHFIGNDKEGSVRRLESASWTDFEHSFHDSDLPERNQSEADRYQIIQARLMRDGEVTEFIIDEVVDYAGFADNDQDLLCEIRIESSDVAVVWPDHNLGNLEDFNSMGADFWKQWEKQTRNRLE